MTDRRQQLLFFLLLGGVIVLAAAEIAILVPFRETWVDEFFSAFKGYLILTGELMPFQNGIFDYAPLVIPTYGALHYIFGPSIFAARVFSAVLFAGVLGLSFLAARRMSGRLAGIAALFLILSNLLLVGNYISATMYSLTMLLLLGTVCIEASGMERRRKTIACAILLALAVLARTNMMAAIILYVGYLALAGLRREIPFFLGVLAPLVLVGYLPLVVFSPWVALSFILSPFVSFGPYTGLPSPQISQSLPRLIEVLVELIREYYGFLLVFFTMSGYALWRQRRGLGEFLLRREPAYFLLLLFSAGLLASHYFYWRLGGNVYYANYFMPFMAIASAVGAVKFLPQNRFATVVLAAAILLNFSMNLYRTDVISDPREESDLARVGRGAAFVRASTRPADLLLTFDNSLYHVFLADRRTFLPLMQRNFLFLPDADTEKVRGLGFYNFAILKEWAERDADYVLIHKEQWPLSLIRSPFWGSGSEDSLIGAAELQKIFDTQYELVGTALNVYPRKYTKGNDGGTLEIYKRKKQ